MVNSNILNRQALSEDDNTHPDRNKGKILLVTDKPSNTSDHFLLEGIRFQWVDFTTAIGESENMKQGAILVFETNLWKFMNPLKTLKSFARKNAIPFVLLTRHFDARLRAAAMDLGFDDYLCGEFSKDFVRKAHLIQKIKRAARSKKSNRVQLRSESAQSGSNMEFIMRYVDITISLLLIIILLPLFIAIAIGIKLESKGPVLYVSKRAGRNYRIFDFYKFRSMRNDAETQLINLADRNQYGKAVFFKIKNDPRITRFGRFLRNTSIDELPQLLNVLKGDMSLVGNRPLPLYEAEQLTCDRKAKRFLAPAGITGLWQITKRGKSDVSEEERIKLDIDYADNASLSYNLKILISTIPAMIQKEEV